MDMVSFNSLFASVSRLRTQERVEKIWSGALAAQGSERDIKRATKAWLRDSGIGPEDDAEEIASLFGSANA